MRTLAHSFRSFLSLAIFVLLSGCGFGGPKVVVYSSQDPEFAEPILAAYADEAHVDVIKKFDVESTKTVGLTQLLIQESPRPRCDLFWNNEILNTLRLREKGMLASWSPPNAADIPAEFKARDGTWYGFAARARILIVNTKLMAEADRPRGLADLLDPRWKGKIAIAKPLFGTTATHATCLFAAWGDVKAKAFFTDLKKNEVQVLSGNKQVATAVGTGQALFGLTDTDDAMGENAVHPQCPGHPQRGTAPQRGRGAGQRPARADDRREARQRSLRPDPLEHEDGDPFSSQDAQDRPRHACRLRGRRQDLGPGRRVPCQRIRRRVKETRFTSRSVG
jgi:iron(III) transport system substrate-binding protein